MLNVADTRRFQLAADTEAIMKRVFGNVSPYNLRMRRLPSYQHFTTSYRSEKILVSLKLSFGQDGIGSSNEVLADE